MSLQTDTLSRYQVQRLDSCRMLCGVATNTNCIVLVAWPGQGSNLRSHNRGDHAYHYTTDVVVNEILLRNWTEIKL